MKKIVFVLVLCLLTLSCMSVNTFASDTKYLDFLNEEWSKDNQYPDWYGGRYLDNGKMTYVVVEGYENQAAEILKLNSYVTKKYSYNKLIVTLDEITKEWMSTQPKNEVVSLQSAGLDEINNCISIEIYSGGGKVDSVRDALYKRYGTLVTITTTDLLFQVTTKPEQQIYYWQFITFTLIAVIGMFIIWRKQASRKMSLQTVNGDVIESPQIINTAKTISIIKSATSSPDNSVFEEIMNDIEKT